MLIFLYVILSTLCTFLVFPNVHYAWCEQINKSKYWLWILHHNIGFKTFKEPQCITNWHQYKAKLVLIKSAHIIQNHSHTLPLFSSCVRYLIWRLSSAREGRRKEAGDSIYLTHCDLLRASEGGGGGREGIDSVCQSATRSQPRSNTPRYATSAAADAAGRRRRRSGLRAPAPPDRADAAIGAAARLAQLRAHPHGPHHRQRYRSAHKFFLFFSSWPCTRCLQGMKHFFICTLIWGAK